MLPQHHLKICPRWYSTFWAHEYFYVSDELSDFMYLLISAKKEIEKEEGVEATSLLQDKHYLAIFKDFFFGELE